MELTVNEIKAIEKTFEMAGDSLEDWNPDPIEDIPNYISADPAIWGNPDASNYYSSYIVKVNFMGHNILWHKWAVYPLLQAQVELKKINYDWKVLQTYNNRNIRGSTRKSMHAWPLAFDVNPAQNPYRSDNKLITDIPQSMVVVLRKHGFAWGGAWRTLKDPMHFEYIGAPVKKEQPHPDPTPEEDMTSEERDLLKRVRLSTMVNSFDSQIIIAMLNGDADEAKRLLADKEEALAAERKRLGL